ARVEVAAIGRALGAVVIPGRAVFQFAEAVLVKITTQPQTIDIKGDDFVDVEVNPLIDVDVVAVEIGRGSVSPVEATEIGGKLVEVVFDVSRLRRASSIGEGNPIRRDIDESASGRGKGGFAAGGAVDGQDVAAGHGGIGRVFHVELGDIDA